MYPQKDNKWIYIAFKNQKYIRKFLIGTYDYHLIATQQVLLWLCLSWHWQVYIVNRFL